MNGWIENHVAIIVPPSFVLMWLGTTTLFGVSSGWFRLMRRFPDQPMEPVFRLRGQSGSMGVNVGMRGILTLSVCDTGLRIGMMRVFGPFCRSFFVPWDDVLVTRISRRIWPLAKLQFGSPVAGSLTISAGTAARLARAAAGRWPQETGLPVETRGGVRLRLLLAWALMTCGGALFFTLVPLVAAPAASRPPIVAGVLFPAIFFGIVTLVSSAS